MHIARSESTPLGVALLFQQDGTRTIMLLTIFAWCYLMLAAALFFVNCGRLIDHYELVCSVAVRTPNRQTP
jgi:hypothetical protein